MKRPKNPQTIGTHSRQDQQRTNVTYYRGQKTCDGVKGKGDGTEDENEWFDYRENEGEKGKVLASGGGVNSLKERDCRGNDEFYSREQRSRDRPEGGSSCGEGKKNRTHSRVGREVNQ